MRKGFVAVGIVMVIFGFSFWYFIPYLGRLNIIPPSLTNAVYLYCVMPIILILVGFMLFIVGLVGKTAAELAAMRGPTYVMAPPPYPPPSYVQPPPPRLPPPPPPQAPTQRRR